MDHIPVNQTITIIKMVEKNGQVVPEEVQLINIMWEIFMNYYYYGPCWRCEGMGV